MSAMPERTRDQGTSMRLDARLSDGNVILCTARGDEHSFIVRHLDVSVECPPMRTGCPIRGFS
jgi:hypothetical protein